MNERITNTFFSFEENLFTKNKNFTECVEEINLKFTNDTLEIDDIITIFIACYNCIVLNKKLVSDINFKNTEAEMLQQKCDYIKEKIKPFINTVEQNPKLSTIDKEYFNLLMEGIIWNDKDKLISAFNINNKYSMANLYLFMYYFNEMSFAQGEEKQIYTNEMTKYYNNLNEEFKEHIFKTGKKFRYIPYISFDFKEQTQDEKLEKFKGIFENIINGLPNKKLSIENMKEKINQIQNSDGDYWGIDFNMLDFYFYNFYNYKNYDNNRVLFDKNMSKQEILKQLYTELFGFKDGKMLIIDLDAVEDIVYHKDFMKYVKVYFKESYPALFTTDLEYITKQILQIPTYSYTSKSDLKNAMALSEKLMELEIVNEKLVNEQRQKAELLDKNAHSWKHIVFPSIMLEIAEKLLENGQKDLAVQLFSVQSSQDLLVRNLKSLESEFKYSDIDFKKHFYMSMCSKEFSNAVNIKTVFETALKISLSKLFLGGRFSEGENLFNQENKVKLKEEFIEYIILERENNQNSIVDWFSDKIYPISVGNLQSFDSINFIQDDLAYLKFLDLFLNLINNVLNHGVKTKQGYIDIEFLKQDKTYTISMKNPIDKTTTFLSSQQKGINSIKAFVNKLNDNLREIKVYENDDVYEIIIEINSRYFGI